MNPSRRSLIQRRKAIPEDPPSKPPSKTPSGRATPKDPFRSLLEYDTCSQKPFRSHPEALPNAPSKPPSEPPPFRSLSECATCPESHPESPSQPPLSDLASESATCPECPSRETPP